MINDYYYYYCLDKKKQIIYKKIYNSILKFEVTVNIGVDNISVQELLDMFSRIKKDNPYLYYWNSNLAQMNTLADGNCIIIFQYYFTRHQYASIESKVRENVRKILTRISSKDEMGKVLELHEILGENVEYDFEAISDNPELFKELTSHSMLGVVMRKMAVCDGMAYAVKYLLNALNIKCIVVEGIAKNIVQTKSDLSGHAWNVIKINGIASHFDFTWDLCEKSNIEYDYFGLDDEHIRLDHSWNDQLPICNSMRNDYLYVNNRVFSNTEHLEKYIQNEMKQKPNHIIARLENEEAFKLAEKDIGDYISRCFGFGEKGYILAINRSQRVFHIKIIRD